MAPSSVVIDRECYPDPPIIYLIMEQHLPPMSPDDAATLASFKDRISGFIRARDWEKFHRPKDVAAALSIESSELLELYLWDRKPSREALEDEMADVLFFLLDLSQREGVDLSAAFSRKMAKNEERYPAEKVRGRDDKYTFYQDKAG